MRRMPQSWLGRFFAALTLAVLLLDALTLLGSPAWRWKGTAMFQGRIVALAGGTLRVTHGQFISTAQGASWGPRWQRVWLPSAKSEPSPLRGKVFRMTLPLWTIWAPLALAGWKLDRRFVALWRQPGQCLACGYDLNGLPDHALCPECGGTQRATRREPA